MAEKNPVDIQPQASSSTTAENNFSATPVICRQELKDDGHDIYIEFSITNAILIPEEWTIFQDIATICDETSTTWNLRLILDKPENLQVVSGDARIKRTDLIKDWTVGITFEMKVYHPKFGYHTTVEPFDRQFVSRQILFIEIPNIVPSEHKDLLLHDKLDISLRLSIKDCHKLTPPPPSPKKKSPEKWKPLPLEQRWHHTQR